ncbi:hypothetical protein QR98_0065750 [Sarcoptes scabiei]|uniref:Uncharacterized protein n=1 Tax=Sarcoptes scabiei TaxID=52283 RepID=A0A132AAQ5_SARSC|nr:hypothetical protein QR98_0065750 [Sarcoptes scabiei]
MPTVLYLLIGVFQQLSQVCQTVYDEKIYEKEPVVTFLKCIENLVKSSLINIEAIRSTWIQLLQSAIARILDLSKTSDEDQKQDFISFLLTIGVFVSNAPIDVLQTSQLCYPIINQMTRALQSKNDLRIQIDSSQFFKLD